MSILENTAVVDLAYQGSDPAVVTPNDQGHLNKALGEMATACGMHETSTEFKSQALALVGRLAAWLSAYDEQIDQAFLTRRKGALLFVTQMKSAEHSRNFEDALTELDLVVRQS
jgi:hypothetical protein